MKTLVKVGVLHDKPEAFNCYLKLPNQPCAKPGFEIEIFTAIMRILDLDYQFYNVDSGEYGVKTKIGMYRSMVLAKKRFV